MDNSVAAALGPVLVSLVTVPHVGGRANLQSIIVNTDLLFSRWGINIRNLGSSCSSCTRRVEKYLLRWGHLLRHTVLLGELMQSSWEVWMLGQWTWTTGVLHIFPNLSSFIFGWNYASCSNIPQRFHLSLSGFFKHM